MNLPDTRDDAEARLFAAGYEQVGVNGNFGAAYAKPGQKSILKLYDADDTGYNAFVRFCRKHAGNPHFPKFSKSFVTVGRYYNAIRMERFFPWTGAAAIEETFYLQMYFYNATGIWPAHGQSVSDEREQEMLLKANEWIDTEPSIKAACDLMISELSKYRFDIELKNIMLRKDGTLVFIDPIWEN